MLRETKQGALKSCDALFNIDNKGFLICLQVRRDKDRKQGAFHLHEALFEVLVDNKLEFVQLFMERVDLNEFFDPTRLDRLYREVSASCFRSFSTFAVHSSFYFSNSPRRLTDFYFYAFS